MNLEDITYTKRNQPVTKRKIMYDSNSDLQRQKGESWWLSRAGGRGDGDLFKGHRVPVLQDEKTLADELHNHVNVLSTTELHT